MPRSLRNPAINGGFRLVNLDGSSDSYLLINPMNYIILNQWDQFILVQVLYFFSVGLGKTFAENLRPFFMYFRQTYFKKNLKFFKRN